MRSALLFTGLVIAGSNAGAQTVPGGPAQHAVVALPDKIAFGPAPAILPPGAQLAVMEGNPAEAGSYTMRLRAPSGYRIPPHFHPAFEHVTVIRGTFKVGMGDKFDPSKMTALPAGAFAALAPGVRHYAQTEGETVIQLHGTGPWTLTYVNPSDDPRQRTP
jgi:quercetin dioxygenase-like cupin family protein